MTSHLPAAGYDRHRDPRRAQPSQRLEAIGGPVAVHRLLSFSDAVFAISATLLVLDLRVPPGLGSSGFHQALHEQLPALAAYVLSFALIGLLWLVHHRTFDVVARVDDTMLAGSLVLLCLVAFLPFPVRLLSEYHDEPAAVAIYMATFTAASATQRLLWVHATGRPHLLARVVDDQLRRRYNAMLATTPVGLGVLVPVALLAPRVAVALWVLLLPVSRRPPSRPSTRNRAIRSGGRSSSLAGRPARGAASRRLAARNARRAPVTRTRT